jgi:hypothetical protein
VVPAAHRSGPLKGPLEQVLPRSRVHASLERVPPRSRVHGPLERAPPRSRVRLRLARDSLTRTPIPARGYGHLMLWHGRAAPSCAWESCSGAVAPTPYGEPIPATVGECATWPVSAPWHCAAYSRTANTPRPRRGAGHTPEPLSREPAGPNHDARPAGRHPRHCWSCAAAPVLAAPRRALLQPLRRCEARGDGALPRLPLYPVRIAVNGFPDPV